MDMALQRLKMAALQDLELELDVQEALLSSAPRISLHNQSLDLLFE